MSCIVIDNDEWVGPAMSGGQRLTTTICPLQLVTLVHADDIESRTMYSRLCDRQCDDERFLGILLAREITQTDYDITKNCRMSYVLVVSHFV